MTKINISKYNLNLMFTCLVVVICTTHSQTTLGSTELQANFFTSSGLRFVGNFNEMKNDTIYLSTLDKDGSSSKQAIHKSSFSKVVFFTGEHLDLGLSNYTQEDNSFAPEIKQKIPANKNVEDTKSDSGISKKPTIAITDFEARGGVTQNDASSLSDRFRERLIATGAFRVMERGEMDIILKEQGFQQTGACRDNTCLVEMGQLIAVQKIISGSIGKVGSIYTISAKLLDVETGSIDKTVSEDCDCPIEQVLIKSIDRLARKMADLTPDDTISSVTFTKGDAALFIKSTPTGANIYIGGNRQEGTTPTNIKNLVPGVHTVLLKKTIDGVEWSGQKMVTAVSNKITRVEISMNFEETVLQVNSSPPEAEVYINRPKSLNRFPRHTTPAIIRNIDAGKTSIYFFMPGYRDTTIQIEINPNTFNELKLDLLKEVSGEKINLQSTFIKNRLQRRIGKWTLLLCVVGTGFTSYFAYETIDNRDKAKKALSQLKKDEIRNDTDLYNFWVKNNNTHYYDYRFNLKAFFAAFGATLLCGGTGIVLYF